MKISNFKFQISHPPFKYSYLFLVFLIMVGVFLRFYNLNWGAPFYFHPDERNIASAVTRIEFPNNLNPEFFAYGSAPIYTAYFIGVGQNFIENIFHPIEDPFTLTFERSIIILRILSASLSTLIIFLVFTLLYKKLNIYFSLLGAVLVGLNVGLIQYAHFGTFEIWLTFLFLLLFYSIIIYIEKNSKAKLLLIGIVLGLLISVKVSSIVIVPIALITIILYEIKKAKAYIRKYLLVINSFISLAVILLTAAITYIITSPYTLLDFKAFIGSMNYESGVALGTINVFYSGGFVQSIPIIYQLTYVYPYLLNPINLLILFFFTPILIVSLIKNRNELLNLSILFFLVIFLSQAFLYVKWIRYYIPTIPFLIILIILGLKLLADKIKRDSIKKIALISIFSLLMISSFIHSFSYFYTVLFNNYSTVSASTFAGENIPRDSKLISEVYDMGILPFNSKFSNITLFDFYALDDEWVKDEKREELDNLIISSDYIILPSQRILRNRIMFPNQFPEGNKFYNKLQTDKFDLIYQTPCDFYCKILYLGNPIYSLEETANVFDRPTLFIFKKNIENFKF